MLSNITTNKNRTEIAPTYTISISIAKNSTPSETAKQELKKKTKTNAKIECTGLLVNITKVPTNRNKKNKISKK